MSICMAKSQALDKVAVDMVLIQEDQEGMAQIPEDQEDMEPILLAMDKVPPAMVKGLILTQELILLLKGSITQANHYNSSLVLTPIAIALLLSLKEDAVAILCDYWHISHHISNLDLIIQAINFKG